MKKWFSIAAVFPLLGCSQSDEARTSIQAGKSYVLLSEKESQPTGEKKAIRSKMLDVPLIKQNPELKYGCEVTSLAMVLRYAGAQTDKLSLAEKLKKDPDPLVRNQSGDIIKWGNPNHGFVGDITGRQAGYAVFDEPMIHLMEEYLPGRSRNLTNRPFEDLLRSVANGRPVVVWTTGDYLLPDRWEEWQHGYETIKTPLDLHAVVLVGYNDRYVYINDPLSGKKSVPVNKLQFIKSWEALKKRAVSYE